MSANLTAEFGLRDADGKAWISIATKQTVKATFIWPGGPKEALAITQQVNALKLARTALKAVRADCRDPDTDSALSTKAGELLDEALMALGVKP